MKKRMFPTVHELITGKFLQHSQSFYYWRVIDRTEKIQLYPDSLSLYDDLAWALNKVGQPEKGVEVMLKKEKKSPGLYKTYANLGTCYIHSNQHEKGLEYIKKAIEVNPDAHLPLLIVLSQHPSICASIMHGKRRMKLMKTTG